MILSSYKVNPKHRKQKAKEDCTQWIVDEWEELKLFIEAKNNAWICNKNNLWVMTIKNSEIVPLGKTGQRSESIAYMAKYVTDKNNEWHGYPVSPARSADRPPTNILDSWINKGFINKAKSRKIIKGIW